MTLLQQINALTHQLCMTEQELKDCLLVSRTKKEIQDQITKTVERVETAKEKVRSTVPFMDQFVPGQEQNSISDELYNISNDIGTAIYMLLHGQEREAADLLAEVNIRIKGRP